ncbi:MAG: hypothetical protein CEN88_101 [Candidatus Berkelbacteria bacterium Licking1014_2]|uniref:Translation initiation factor IF-1 n=1 Tax=Candidatus Berkelbacteria bacterium Licking1014_2 TaxID=2017146 RepID=A0A554LWJ7_9BACT|nr:MAG: hypothetical protein CEN88_101 [Candidatus Berkelbacteria bacterium Licking1014_2]
MSKDKQIISLTGEVTESLPNATFRVKLDGSGQEVLAYIGGKMRLHYIKIIPGDRVQVELSPYNLERGRLVRRL